MNPRQTDEQKYTPWRERLHEIVFEADTPAGKAFDVALLWSIVLSILAVCLESVAPIRDQYGPFLRGIEWFFTILFSIEYIVRSLVVRHPLHYVRSFFGVVDLLAVLPTYLSLFFPGAQNLLVIRGLRLLRIFRVLKLGRYIGEARELRAALASSRQKIVVFLMTVLTVVVIVGALMYLIEGPRYGFTSIPRSMYWAIVTMTTVGYGDISPQTPPGQFLASLLMVLGYGIIAVPTGIVSAELVQAERKRVHTTQVCPECLKEGHDPDATFCKYCGGKL